MLISFWVTGLGHIQKDFYNHLISNEIEASLDVTQDAPSPAKTRTGSRPWPTTEAASRHSKRIEKSRETLARLIEGICGKLEADAEQPDITWVSIGSPGRAEELLRESDEFLS